MGSRKQKANSCGEQDSLNSQTTQSSEAEVSNCRCVICYEMYNDSKRLPKTLVCGHTFCQACIRKNTSNIRSTVSCAVCRTDSKQLPSQLKTNFQFLSLLKELNLLDCSSSEVSDDGLEIKNTNLFRLRQHLMSLLTDEGNYPPDSLMNLAAVHEILKKAGSETWKRVYSDLEHLRNAKSQFAEILGRIKDYVSKDTTVNDILNKAENFPVDEHSVVGINFDDPVHSAMLEYGLPVLDFDDEYYGEENNSPSGLWSQIEAFSLDDDDILNFMFSAGSDENTSLLEQDDVDFLITAENNQGRMTFYCTCCNCFLPNMSESARLTHIQGRQHCLNLRSISPRNDGFAVDSPFAEMTPPRANSRASLIRQQRQPQFLSHFARSEESTSWHNNNNNNNHRNNIRPPPQHFPRQRYTRRPSPMRRHQNHNYPSLHYRDHRDFGRWRPSNPERSYRYHSRDSRQYAVSPDRAYVERWL